MIDKIDVLYVVALITVGIYGLFDIRDQYHAGAGSLGEAVFVSLVLLGFIGFCIYVGINSISVRMKINKT